MTDQPVDGLGPRLRGAASRLLELVRAIADTDPEEIEATARRLGSSRRYLAPVAWVAGMLVLVVRGIGLLLTNWRRLALEALPATWVWLTMWSLRHGDRQAPPLHDLTVIGVVLAVVAASVASIAALWCNCVFGFAISRSHVSVLPAIRQTWPFRRRLLGGGIVVGVGVATGFALIPNIESFWLYAGAVWAMYGILLSALVV